MLATINAMSRERLVYVKGLVDWVEEYEVAESANSRTTNNGLH